MSKYTSVIVILALLLGAAFALPWHMVKWGKIELLPASSITVSGEAQTQTDSQIASFTAGVSEINDNRDTAVKNVNDKVTALIQAVKDFGIPESDIKTQNLSIYQMEEPITIDGRQRTQAGQWRVSNDVLVTLRDVNRASELADLLSGSGATNVYGPNFALDDTQDAQVGLLEQAIQNAREKAQAIAAGSNKKLGDILNVQEGVVSGAQPFYNARMEMGGGGGAPIEPGSQTVSKTVTVTFELR